MDHQHPVSPAQRRAGARHAFRWSILLNVLLTALQLVIGFSFGSLALIGDAVHNLGDVAGLTFGWSAERLSRRPPTQRFTYGLGRSTQLASLANAVLILMAAAVVTVEAIQRLWAPVPMVSAPVAWAAAAGIVVNLLSARLFGDDHHHDLNRRAAVIHLLTDAAVSVAVLVSALLVGLTGWSWLDPLTAIGVGLVVAWSGWGLLREATLVALDGVPRSVDLDRVEQTLLSLPGVVGVHHLHVWGMSTSRVALTAQLARRASETDDRALLNQVSERLAGLGIVHCTIQLEPADFVGASCPR